MYMRNRKVVDLRQIKELKIENILANLKFLSNFSLD
jgi:hypothetical protein